MDGDAATKCCERDYHKQLKIKRKQNSFPLYGIKIGFAPQTNRQKNKLINPQKKPITRDTDFYVENPNREKSRDHNKFWLTIIDLKYFSPDFSPDNTKG